MKLPGKLPSDFNEKFLPEMLKISMRTITESDNLDGIRNGLTAYIGLLHIAALSRIGELEMDFKNGSQAVRDGTEQAINNLDKGTTEASEWYKNMTESRGEEDEAF